MVEYMSMKEAAQFTGFTTVWLANRFDKGKIAGIRDARSYRLFDVASLKAYMQAHKNSPKYGAKRRRRHRSPGDF